MGKGRRSSACVDGWHIVVCRACGSASCLDVVNYVLNTRRGKKKSERAFRRQREKVFRPCSASCVGRGLKNGVLFPTVRKQRGAEEHGGWGEAGRGWPSTRKILRSQVEKTAQVNQTSWLLSRNSYLLSSSHVPFAARVCPETCTLGTMDPIQTPNLLTPRDSSS